MAEFDKDAEIANLIMMRLTRKMQPAHIVLPSKVPCNLHIRTVPKFCLRSISLMRNHFYLISIFSCKVQTLWNGVFKSSMDPGTVLSPRMKFKFEIRKTKGNYLLLLEVI